MPRWLKYPLIAVLGAVLILVLYWGKCQLGINLIPGVSWERRFPVLNALQKREYWTPVKAGVLLSSTFDEILPFLPWNDVWARDKDAVDTALVRGGRKGSRCLQVRSSSARDWALYHSHVAAVTPGELFSFEGYVRTSGDAMGQLSVILYDQDRKVLDWGCAARKVRSSDWTSARNWFEVPRGAAYLRFQLTGAGAGEVYFDDLRFVKE